LEEKRTMEIEKYADIYEKNGYDLVSSAGIFVPWFQCTLKCLCMSEQPMSELDNVVCRCITSEINTIEDIAFVLALDVRIVEAEIEELLLSGILLEKDGTLYLTENGSLLHKRNMKVENVKEEFFVAINAVTGEWSVSVGERLSKAQISKDAVCLQPLRTVVKHELEENRELLTALQREHSVNIASIKLLDYITVNYQE